VKYLYCPKCKKYPDKVDKIYTRYVEPRAWDGKCYAKLSIGKDYSSCYCCGECGHVVEEKHD